MKTLEAWIEDMPQQFHGKRNIEILLSAFSRQLDEIMHVFDDLKEKTEIDTAFQKNLDGVGDILNMSRRDATAIVREAMTYTMSDELYRQVLRYQKLKASTECTYEDIMGAISLLWDTSKISYVEDPSRPATILFSLPEVGVDAEDPAVGRILSIKPAGVAAYYTVEYLLLICSQELEKVYFSKLALKNEFPFWKTLYWDGTLLFDGTHTLNSFTIPLGFSITVGAAKAFVSEVACLSFMSMGYKEQLFEGMAAPLLSLAMHAQICEEVEKSMAVSLSFDLGDDEKIEVETVRKKGLWYFDGSYLFDGTKRLDALLDKEVL